MDRRIDLFSTTALLLTVGLFGAACNSAPTAEGDGSIASYSAVTGRLTTTLAHPLDEVRDAAVQAAEELRYGIEKNSADSTQAELLVREATDDAIRIYLRRRGPEITEVTIGVGPFGGEDKARVLLDRLIDSL